MRRRGDLVLLLGGVLVWLLSDAQRVKTAAGEALALCAGTVIPALFPFLAVSGLAMALGLGEWLSPALRGLMGPLYRLPGTAAAPLVLGLLGGYPIGARTAAELYREGALTRDEAERLLTFCNNANPAFFLSVLGAGVFGSVRAPRRPSGGRRRRLFPPRWWGPSPPPPGGWSACAPSWCSSTCWPDPSAAWGARWGRPSPGRWSSFP